MHQEDFLQERSLFRTFSSSLVGLIAGCFIHCTMSTYSTEDNTHRSRKGVTSNCAGTSSTKSTGKNPLTMEISSLLAIFEERYNLSRHVIMKTW